MTAMTSYSTGTVSVSDGDTAIVAASGGPIWYPPNVQPGDTIYVDDGRGVEIKDVTVSPATLTLWSPWDQGNKVSVPYIVVQEFPSRVVGAAAAQGVGKLISALNENGFYVAVPPTATAPDPSLGEEDQYAIQAGTGKVWQRTGGAWVLVETLKGFGTMAPWSAATAYAARDVVSLNGASYVCILANTNQSPPNATYWMVLAAQGNTGPNPFSTLAPWATATAYLVGPPASYVSINGSSYVCLVSHTSGTFATDLAAGKWGLVAQQGLSYGGTSTTSLAIGTGSKVFTTQAGLAYTNGARVRASSAANTSNWMEGLITYSGTTLTMTADKVNGSGTHADWNLNVVGQPGAGDLSSTNNLSDVASAATAATNLSAVRYAAQTLTGAQKDQASTNIGTVRAIRVQKFTASGTYTPDPHMLYAIIECQGGGGSGGSIAFTAGTNFTTGSGGGGGAYARLLATAANVGASQSVAVGAGGAAAAGGANNGTAGGQSNVGTLCVASGGAGGAFAQAGVSVQGGGAGGQTGTGDLVIPGGGGGAGVGGSGIATTFIPVGWGGCAHFGGGPASVVNSNGIAAAAGSGAGGSGGQDLGAGSRSGGAGGSGLILITEYCSQ